MDRLYACPGSERECVGIQEFRDPKVERWAQFGRNVHLWLETGFIDLEPDELEIAEQCRAQRDEVEAMVFEGMAPERVAERRYWLTDATGRKRMSGQVDYAARRGAVGLIQDYKSGRGQYDEAPANMQLRCNAVLFWRHHNRALDKVVVALIQPILGKPTVCEYTRADLVKAEHQILAILDAAEVADAKLKAGPHCQYCPAKVKCMEMRRVIGVVATVSEQEVAAKNMTDLIGLYLMCMVISPTAKAVIAELKQRMKNGQLAPGLKLSKASSVRSFEDVPAIWARAHQHQLLDQATFLRDVVSVGIGDMEKAVGKALALKPAQAKEKVNAIFADLIVAKPKEPSIEQI